MVAGQEARNGGLGAVQLSGARPAEAEGCTGSSATSACSSSASSSPGRTCRAERTGSAYYVGQTHSICGRLQSRRRGRVRQAGVGIPRHGTLKWVGYPVEEEPVHERRQLADQQHAG